MSRDCRVTEAFRDGRIEFAVNRLPDFEGHHPLHHEIRYRKLKDDLQPSPCDRFRRGSYRELSSAKVSAAKEEFGFRDVTLHQIGLSKAVTWKTSMM